MELRERRESLGCIVEIQLRQDRIVQCPDGSRQKVANYAGVTVERKEGSLLTPSGLKIRILDLPGAYSLTP